MRRAALLALLAPLVLAGCVASAGPAKESVIENVAPLPASAPGVVLAWTPPADPLRLAPGDCATVPWALQARDLPHEVRVGLDLSSTRGLDGLLVGSVTPDSATIAGDELANGTALVCASQDAPAAQGNLSLLAQAGNETLAVATIAVEITG